MNSRVLLKSIVFGLIFTLSLISWGEEESFSFDEMDSSQPAAQKSPHGAGGPPTMGASGIKIFGKVGLTSEFTPFDRDQVTTNNQFPDERHFLIFLNAKPQENISFTGEIIAKSFYFVDYKFDDTRSLQFGNILVPFGETDRYHHLYGGNVNLNGNGIMFPNIWAENGFNYRHRMGSNEWDLYWVSGIDALDGSQEPVTNAPSSNTQQAGGLRYTRSVSSGFVGRVSYYYTEWRANSPLHAFGLDAKYNWLVRLGPLQGLDLQAGVAKMDIQKTNTSDFMKSGDYFECGFVLPQKNKLRVRYGTYDNDDRVDDSEDRKSWSLAWLKRIRALSLLLEHQWNLEQENETDNDILRFMVTLDF